MPYIVNKCVRMDKLRHVFRDQNKDCVLFFLLFVMSA